MNKFKVLLLNLLVMITVSFGGVGLAFAAEPIEPGPQPPSATEAAKQQVCQGISRQVGDTCNATATTIDDVMRVVLAIISIIAGIAAIIMVMISGIKYTTSGGDSTKISSAKSTLIYAIIGIVVVAMSQIIVQFVLDRASP